MLRDVTHTFWSENRVQDCAVCREGRGRERSCPDSACGIVYVRDDQIPRHIVEWVWTLASFGGGGFCSTLLFAITRRELEMA